MYTKDDTRANEILANLEAFAALLMAGTAVLLRNLHEIIPIELDNLITVTDESENMDL